MTLKTITDTQYGGRKWEWRTTAGIDNWEFYFGTEMLLIEFEGKPIEFRMVDYYLLGFRLNPLRWRIYQNDSTWYDGPHNLITIGPFTLSWRHPALKKARL